MDYTELGRSYAKSMVRAARLSAIRRADTQRKEGKALISVTVGSNAFTKALVMSPAQYDAFKLGFVA